MEAVRADETIQCSVRVSGDRGTELKFVSGIRSKSYLYGISCVYEDNMT